MGEFFMQLGASGLRTVMNIAIISAAIVLGIQLRKYKDNKTSE